MRQTRVARWAGLLGGLVLGVAGCGSGAAPVSSAPQPAAPNAATPTGSPTSPAAPSVAPVPSATASATTPAASSPAAGSAIAELGTLAVHGANSMAGYGRKAFGPEWADVDGNSCDTRVICTIQRHAHESYE